MKFYIVSTFDNHEQVNALADLLEALGHKLTFKWTVYHPESPGYAVLSDEVDLQAIALQELAGVYSADVVIVLAPVKFGSHVEMGAALAFSRPVVLIGEPGAYDMSNPFYHHPRVTRMEIRFDQLDVDGALVPLMRFLSTGQVPALPHMEG